MMRSLPPSTPHMLAWPIRCPIPRATISSFGLSIIHPLSSPSRSTISLTIVDQGPTRALNISSFKKSAPRATSFSVGVDPDTAQNQDQGNIGSGTSARTTVKGSAPRIYAPRPFTPPAVTSQVPAGAFSVPDFKAPSLPFSKSADEAAGAGQGPGETINTRSSMSTSTSDTTASNPFRPMSCRPGPQDEVGAQARRPLAHQSFFGSAQFSFDSVASSLDDSGYYSPASEQNDHPEGGLFAPAKRSAPVRPPTGAGGEVRGAARGAKMQALGGNDMIDVDFVNPTKRIRPASPGDDEDMVLTGQGSRSRDLPKRPCVDRSPSRSYGALPRAAALENASAGGTQTFILPPNVPHPAAAMGDLPGLAFSEVDLGRYAELYEHGSERWSKATMEEWLGGANDIMVKFTEMIDMIKEHMSSKVNLYKSLHAKLAEEHTALEQRANELRDASQTLVRDSGSIGGGLEPNNIDTRTF
ncbi:hypothetical protein BJV78DRAFT_899458 [Lactifluus subvellereus]|nr:hypothetical protein BJV78DRAFT_899458 [Lactifluus subvellereus]